VQSLRSPGHFSPWSLQSLGTASVWNGVTVALQHDSLTLILTPVPGHNTNVNPNSYANPNLAMSDCYIQACGILGGGCSGISMVSRVRFRVKVRLRTDMSRD